MIEVPLAEMSEKLRLVLAAARQEGTFDPAHDWEHLGLLVTRMEEKGYFLMVNSSATTHLKRVASFHLVSERGFPCAGSSEWGPFPTIGEAVLRAAYEALFHERPL